MQLLLDHNAYIDAESPNGTTPLMMAAQYGTPAAVKLLLSAGADPLIRNSLSMSALNFAIKAERFDTIKILRTFINAMPERRIPDVIIR
jgi:ankyrin repeat protein